MRSLVLVAAALGIVAISGHAFFSFPRERPTPTALTWLYLGLVAGMVSQIRIASGTDRGPSHGRLAGTLPAVLLVILTVCGGVHVFRGFRADAAYYQGILARAKGQWEEAVHHLDRAASIGVFDYRYLLQKSQVAQHLGRLDEALVASQTCLDYHPNSISAWYNVGQLQSSLGNYKAARDALLRTVQLDPDNGSAYGHLGVVYRRMGMADSARVSYTRALERSPGDALIHYNAAGYYREQAEVSRARELYARSTGLNPAFAPAQRGLAEALGTLGEFEAAAETYRNAIDLDSETADAHYGLGLMLERLGDRSGAAGAYRNFLGRWRGSPEVARKVRGYLRRLEENPTGGALGPHKGANRDR
jgi:tetratricopeptide (TPR) repeat protein